MVGISTSPGSLSIASTTRPVRSRSISATQWKRCATAEVHGRRRPPHHSTGMLASGRPPPAVLVPIAPATRESTGNNPHAAAASHEYASRRRATRSRGYLDFPCRGTEAERDWQTDLHGGDVQHRSLEPA